MSNRRRGGNPVLGMIVDRSSFDETEDYFLAEDDSVNVNAMHPPPAGSNDGPDAVVMKNGKVRRRLRWKPRHRRSSKISSNASVTSIGDASNTTNRSERSYHTFNSSETPVQSNKKQSAAGGRLNNARPQYRGNYGGVSTINSEGGFVHLRMNSVAETKPATKDFKQLSVDTQSTNEQSNFDPYGSSRAEKSNFDPYGAPPLPPRVGRTRSNTKPARPVEHASASSNQAASLSASSTAPPAIVSPISTPPPTTHVSSSPTSLTPIAPLRINFDGAQGSTKGDHVVTPQETNYGDNLQLRYPPSTLSSESIMDRKLTTRKQPSASNTFDLTMKRNPTNSPKNKLGPVPIVSPILHRSEPIAMAQPESLVRGNDLLLPQSVPSGTEMVLTSKIDFPRKSQHSMLLGNIDNGTKPLVSPEMPPSEDADTSAKGIDRVALLASSAGKGRSNKNDNSGEQKETKNGENEKTREVDSNLQAIQTMAAEHLAHGEFDEALEVFVEILRGQLERHGPAHHRVGTALHNIGIVHLKKRNYEKVIQVGEQAVRVRKAALGPNHPDVAVSIAQMGLAYLESKRCREALKSFQRALNIRKVSLGSKHPKVAKVLNNIGCTLSQLGRLDEALNSFEEALAIQRVALRSPLNNIEGESRSKSSFNQLLLSTASSLCNISSIKLRQGRYDEANLDLEEALLIQQSVLGDGHATVQSTLDNIGMVEKLSGDHSNSSDKDLYANVVTSPTFETISLTDVTNERRSFDQTFISESTTEDRQLKTNAWYRFVEGIVYGACGPMQDCKEKDEEDISLR